MVNVSLKKSELEYLIVVCGDRVVGSGSTDYTAQDIQKKLLKYWEKVR